MNLLGIKYGSRIELREKIQKWLAAVMAVCVMAGAPVQEVCASAIPVEKQSAKKQSGTKQSAKKQNGTKQTSKNQTGKKQPAKSQSTKSKAAQTKPNSTKSKAELTKMQKSAQEEVKKTREEIRKNEHEIQKSLNELSILEDGIAVSKKETETLSAEVGKLSTKISGLEANIEKNTKELERIRGEYLKAVKKMRISRKKNSGMVYLFSAKNLAQAERRMRYLKEFSEWKDKKTKEISAKVESLRVQNEQLQHAKKDKDIMLGRELKAQKKLNEQKGQQDLIIKDLKANGEALKEHLAKKQSEVNMLNNQVAAVIAEEQRKAEEQRRKKAEADRLAAERKAREREAAERKAAEEKATAERLAQEKAEREKEAAKKEVAKNEPVKKETPKKETTQKEVAKKDSKTSEGNLDYAKARNRKPRDPKQTSKKAEPKKEIAKQQAPKKEEPKKETPKTSAPKKEESQSGGFAAMRGALPRPVGGAFRVTGKFGRHSLPDLPNVTYDNPGIDVEVAKGATVSSVYQGTVSGVYVLPGFSTVVIISHGDYYTVYGNLASASVKVGDNVKQGHALGRLTEDADNPGHSSLHFEVWKGREKVNPSNWIK